MLIKAGNVLNVQPHLISVCLGSSAMIQETILTQKFDSDTFISIMLNGLEKERLQLIQHYINAYRGDLVE